MNLNKSKLEEHEPLTHLLNVLPQKAQKGLASLSIEYTCIDVLPQYIALGTNVGLVLLYDRLSRSLQRLNCKLKTEVITCVRMAESVDYVVAAGTLSGNVFVFQLPSVLPGRAKRMQLYCVSDVHFSRITCVEWSQNTLKLFSGDYGGCVACTEMDYGQHQSKSYVVVEEPHEIVHLDYSFKRLLVSTTFRTIVCTLDLNEKQRLGTKDRKVLGSYAACFKPELCRSEDATIFATRPGLRLWKSDIEGNVLATYMFKDLLSGNTPVIQVLPDTGHGHSSSTIEEKSFGVIKIYAGNKLVTWSEGTLYVINPDNGTFEGWHSNLGNIKDLSVCSDEIFILRGGTDQRLVIRIADHRDPLNEQVPSKQSALHTASHSSPSPVHRLQQTASSLADAIFGVGEKIKGTQETQLPPWGSAEDQSALSSPDIDSCKEANSQSSGNSSVTSPVKEKSLGQPTVVLDSPDTLTVTLQNVAIEESNDVKTNKTAPADSRPKIKHKSQGTNGSPSPRSPRKNTPLPAEDDIVFSRHKGRKKRVKSDKDNGSPLSLNISLKTEDQAVNDSPVVIDTPELTSQTEADLWNKFNKSSNTAFSLNSSDNQYTENTSQDATFPTTVDLSGTSASELPVNRFQPDVEMAGTSRVESSVKTTPTAVELPKSSAKELLTKTFRTQVVDSRDQTDGASSVQAKDELSAATTDKDVTGGKIVDSTGGDPHLSDFIDRLINDNKKQQPKESVVVKDDLKDNEFLKEVIKTHSEAATTSEKHSTDDVSLRKDQYKPLSSDSRDKLVNPASSGKQVEPKSVHSSTSRYKTQEPKQVYSDEPTEPKHVYRSTDSSSDDFYSMFKRSSSIVSPGWSPEDEGNEPSIEDALDIDVSPAATNQRNKKDLRQTLADTWAEFLAPGNLVGLCLTSRHIWCVDKSDRLHYSGLGGPGLKWRKIDEPAKQVSVSRSGWIVWRLHNGSAYAGTAITTRAPAGMKWVEAARGVAFIAVDDSVAWYIKSNGDILMQKNLSRQRPSFRAVKVECQAKLLQIACQDNVVWAVTEARSILVRTGIKAGVEEGTGWTSLGKEGVGVLASSLSFGDNDTAWVVDVVGRVYFTTGVTWDNPCGTGYWWQVSLSEYLMDDFTALDTLKSIATFPQNLGKILAKEQGGLITVGSNGIWICPGRKHVLHVCRGGITGHRFNIVLPAGMATSAQWLNISAGSVDSDGLIWAQQPNNAFFCFPAQTKKFSEVSQPDTASPFVCISSAKEGVWGLLGDGQVLVRSGMAAHCPRGLNWIKLDLMQLGSAKLVHLSCSQEGVWAVDNNGMLYLRMGIKPPERSNPSYLNPAWVPVDGTAQGIGAKFSKVFSGPTDWMVWSLDNKKQVYCRRGISDSMPIGTDWSYVPGTSAEMLCLSERYVYALNTNGEVLVRFGVTTENPGGNYWKKVPGAFRSVTVTAQDDLYGINMDRQLCQRTVYYLQRQDVLEHLGNGPTDKDGVGEDWELI